MEQKINKEKTVLTVLKKYQGVNSQTIFRAITLFGFTCNLKRKQFKEAFLLYINKLQEIFILLKKKLKRYKYVLFSYSKEIGLEKTKRLLLGLPARGQRTHTNANTVFKARKKKK